MPDRLYAFVFLIIVLIASAVSAETPVPGMNTGPASASPPPPVASESAARIVVEVKDDLLSVDLSEAEFGGVMNAIAAKAGIKVDMSGSIAGRKLTTRFSGIELGRGIGRLMTLLQEKNYTIRYDSRGRVAVVEVYSGSAVSSPPKTPLGPGLQPAQPATMRPPAALSGQPFPGVQKNPPRQRRLIPLRQPASPVPTQEGTKEDVNGNGADESPEEELPYIPPPRRGPPRMR